MRIAICHYRNHTSLYIREYLYNYLYDKTINYTVSVFQNFQQLLYEFSDGKTFDIIFTSDSFPNLSQNDILQHMDNANFQGSVIFTAQVKKSLSQCHTSLLYEYFIPPYSYEHFCPIMHRVLQHRRKHSFYLAHSGKSTFKINCSDIIYVESLNSKCIIHSSCGKKYAVYKHLDDIEKEIDNKYFLRCHQSYLVNMKHIRQIEKNFELKNGDIISICQRHIKSVRESYQNFLKNSSLTENLPSEDRT